MSWRDWFRPLRPDPALEARLVAAARAVAEERGWTWREPAAVEPALRAGERTWTVRSNALARGTNVVVTLREADLAVLEARFLPR